MKPLAFVKVKEVICDKHGRLRCYGSEAKYTRIPGLLLAADELRKGTMRCRHCRAEGSEIPTLRFETEPVTEEYVLKKRPAIARDRKKLAAWIEAST